MQNIFLLGIFGAAGVLCRYGIDKWLFFPEQGFPQSTFIINVVGSLTAGVVFALGEKNEISGPLLLYILVGFCGGFTTFSAYALQGFQMIDLGKATLAIFYLLISPAVSLLAVVVAVFSVRKLFGN